MAVKVAVIGGGSTYTPELVEGLSERAEFPIDELALFDVDVQRLSMVGGLAERILRKRGWSGHVRITADRAEALEGADFVVVQLRVGGQHARLSDETLAVEFGCLGQETTGPGGFAKALRTVPVVLEIAEETKRLAAPDCWLIDFANPVGIVTQALLDEGHRAIGLCNAAINFRHMFSQYLDVPQEDVFLEHVGLNHLTWIRAVRVEGVDRLPELLLRHGHDIAKEVGLPEQLIVALGAVPSKYLRYYYLTDEILVEQRSGVLRSRDVIDIEQRLLDIYADPQVSEKPELLTRRGGNLYSQAAIRLMVALHQSTGAVEVVNCRNNGAIPNLPDDAVVELPARIDRLGAHPLALDPLAPELVGLVQLAKAYERLAVRAAVSGDRRLALRALLTNPLVGQYQIAEPLLAALLQANRRYLPRFFEGVEQ